MKVFDVNINYLMSVAFVSITKELIRTKNNAILKLKEHSTIIISNTIINCVVNRKLYRVGSPTVYIRNSVPDTFIDD